MTELPTLSADPGRIERIAHEVICALAPLAHSRGVPHLGTVRMPMHYLLQLPGLNVMFTPAAPLRIGGKPQPLLDVWLAPTGGKVFSATWGRGACLPTEIVGIKTGDWLEQVRAIKKAGAEADPA